MARLEDVRAGVSVRGITPEGVAKIVTVKWFGDATINMIYEDSDGAVKTRLVARDEEPSLEVVKSGGVWSFDGDGKLLRLVSLR